MSAGAMGAEKDDGAGPSGVGFVAAAFYVGAGLLAAVYAVHQAGLVGPWPDTWALKGGVLLVLACFAMVRRHWVLTAALLASAGGDIALALDPPDWTAGIAAFALAHLFYIAIFAARIARGGVRWATTPVSAAILLYAVGMLLWLGPDMGALRLPASLYIGVILVMAALAVAARGSWLVALGAAFFVLSDSLIALEAFKDVALGAVPWVWITYAIAQLALAAGIAAGPPRR